MTNTLTIQFTPFPSIPEPIRSKTRRGFDAFDEDVDTSVATVAVPGEYIANAKEWMRGHGTYLETADDAVIAGVAGKVERVNKLISVKPLRARYKPEVGDLVVGRIVEVQARRWKVDVCAYLDAILMLSSINLPGGVQRRKLESDELQMRQFFAEGDLLVSEVQAFFGDGSISLHTRSTSYGKLRNGQLVRVPPNLIPRLKTHFVSLPSGIQLVIGINGLIWVCAGGPGNAQATTEEEEGTALYSNKNDNLSLETRQAISRVAACIHILAEQGAMLTEAKISEAFEASLEGSGLADEAMQGMDTDEACSVPSLLYHPATRANMIAKICAS